MFAMLCPVPQVGLIIVLELAYMVIIWQGWCGDPLGRENCAECCRLPETHFSISVRVIFIYSYRENGYRAHPDPEPGF